MIVNKLYTVQQIQAWDEFTIVNEPIASIDLMERASLRFVEWFSSVVSKEKKIGVFCGPGNNGGDGYAISRILEDRGYEVEILSLSDNRSPDAQINYQRLRSAPRNVNSVNDIDSDLEVLIDAVFGSGLTRPVDGFFAEIIEYLNNMDSLRVSVDIPSGMFGDKINSEGAIFEADMVGTFQIPKRSMLMPECANYCKSFEIIDIGLDPGFNVDCDWYYLSELRMPEKNKFGHKGTNGRLLVVAGSEGKMGACELTSLAALRSGAGLVVAHIPKSGNEILQVGVPEVMTNLDTDEKVITELPDLIGYDAIAVGPGLGTDNRTAAVIQELLEKNDKPIVIDADALNLISQKGLHKLIGVNAVLTPHPKEFERLFGKTKNSFEAIDKQIENAINLKCTIVRKGAHTSIVSRDGKVYFNSTGNKGMATAGSGDVLTGIIGGLLAQGIPVDLSAKLGVYYHGLAGDKACSVRGDRNMISGDIIEYLFR